MTSASWRAVCALAWLLAAGAAAAQTGDPTVTDTLRHRAPRAPRGAAPSDTLGRVVPIAGVEVSTTRASDRLPVAHSTLARDEIERRNTGLDTPMLLSTLPGAYAYSDAGNGIGYSYLFIRGFPQRRISVLVNGVPLNDPESHEVYWIDHPDLLASTSEAQVQRGVGSAMYGAASVGGSVNLETSPFMPARHATATLAYGTWNTRRLMMEGGSGTTPGGWNLYGRYSRIETDGYRDQSDSRLWSYYLAARHESGGQSWRVNLYGGPEETHLAYLGVPQSVLDGGLTGDAARDRRYNPLTYPGERDHFFEPHYELIHSLALGRGARLTQTLFWFDGRGYYDEQRFGRALADYRLAPWTTGDSTLYPRDDYAQDPGGALSTDAQGRYTVERFDLVRRRTVENRHYGWVPRVRIGDENRALTFGGELRAHDGRHYGEVISGDAVPPGTAPGHRYYDYHPRTFTASAFGRAEWTLARAFDLTADLSVRHQAYRMEGDRFDGIQFDQDYTFALPRVGVSWGAPRGVQLYGSWAGSRREPAFRDLYDAEGPGSVPLYRVVDVATNTYQDPLVRPESVSDWELGGRWRSARAALTANVFYMDFRNELVYAGQFNTDLGYPVVGNAARSVHSGIELDARMAFGAVAAGASGGARMGFDVGANTTFSDNHFIEYREVYGTAPGDTVRYDGNPIGFFPQVMANLQARWTWARTALGLEAQHSGRIHVDNTGSEAGSIAPRTVLNLSAGQRMRLAGTTFDLTLRLLNATDRRYETSGYLDYDADGNLVPHLIPAATRSWLGQVTVAF